MKTRHTPWYLRAVRLWNARKPGAPEGRSPAWDDESELWRLLGEYGPDGGMSREKLLDLIGLLDSPYCPGSGGMPSGGPWGPFSSRDEVEWFREKWCSRAPFEWFDILLELLLNSPDMHADYVGEWRYQVAPLLEGFRRQDHHRWLQKIKPLLLVDTCQRTLLIAMSDDKSEAQEALSYLEPMIAEAAKLDETTIIYLVETISIAESAEAQRLLYELQKHVPASLMRAHTCIQQCLAKCQMANR